MTKKPFPKKGGPPLEVNAATVIAVVKSIIETKQELEFISACDAVDARIAIKPEYVELVKKYLISNNLHSFSADARAAVESDRCTPPRK